MRFLAAFFAVLASLLLIYAGKDAFSAQAPPITHTISIQGMRYVPDTLEVAPGDTVIWVNQDTSPHTVTTADNTTLNSGVMAPGVAFTTVVALPPATYEYVCTIHPEMRASITVR